MNTERNGGPGDGPADELQERLTRRFDSELAKAQRDYPNLSLASRTGARGDPRGTGGWSWPKLASGVVAVGVLAVVGLIGAGLASKPAQVSGPSDSNPPRAADGLPAQIDGQTVYRVADQASFPTTGVYLVGGYVVQEPSCLPASLKGPCYGLAAGPRSDATAGAVELGEFQEGGAWVGAPVVVLMANCTFDNGTTCPDAPKNVVWPAIPTELNGERVYRAADQASFPTSGSFLLGGRVSRPDVVPPCPMPLNQTQAEQQLIPYCYVLSIDGLGVAPKSNLDAPKNEIVVARVHVNDSGAAECPAAAQEQCKSSIVVESVVWQSDELIVAIPTASASPLLPNGSPGGVTVPSQSPGVVGTGEGIGPTSVPSSQPSTVVVGNDGVPVTYGGQTVYRASIPPNSATFLLGGALTSVLPCTGQSAASSCEYWVVDGLVLVDRTGIRSPAPGTLVVVRVEVSKTVGTCIGNPCSTTKTLVVTELVWTGKAVSVTPPPLLSLPPAPTAARSGT